MEVKQPWFDEGVLESVFDEGQSHKDAKRDHDVNLHQQMKRYLK